MSEVWLEQGSGTPAVQAPAHEGPTAGYLLRRAREAAGLHVAALAVSLKVPVRKLEALEADRYDLLTDAVFARALASSVCRALKTDPQPVLERLPQTAAPRLIQVGEGINAPFRAPSDGAAPNWLEHLNRPVFLAVFALLLGALVLILLPTAQWERGTAPVAGSQATPEPSVAANLPTPAAGPVAPSLTPAVMTVAAPATAPEAAPAALAAAVPTTATAIAPAAVAPAASAAAAPASGTIVFRAKGPSWVEVTDAKGVVALRKLMAAGEDGAASGALPLQVTIGRVDVTEVQVRGKAFDLRTVSRDNVARFEVK